MPSVLPKLPNVITISWIKRHWNSKGNRITHVLQTFHGAFEILWRANCKNNQEMTCQNHLEQTRFVNGSLQFAYHLFRMKLAAIPGLRISRHDSRTYTRWLFCILHSTWRVFADPSRTQKNFCQHLRHLLRNGMPHDDQMLEYPVVRRGWTTALMKP